MTKLVDFNNFIAKFIEENQPAKEILNNLPHQDANLVLTLGQYEV